MIGFFDPVPCEFESITRIQDSLYEGNFDILDVDTVYLPTLAHTLVNLVEIRPFKLDEIANYCVFFMDVAEFFNVLVEKSIEQCNVLVYKLFNMGCISVSELNHFLTKQKCIFPYIYFTQQISCYDILANGAPDREIFNEFCSKEYLNELIDFGFPKNSLEYIIKYDDVSGLLNKLSNPLMDEHLKWTPFEWSKKPSSLSMIVFAAHFGSIHCYKVLLMNGYKVSEHVLKSIVFSGCHDMLHLLNKNTFDYQFMITNAIEFCHPSIINWIGCSFDNWKSFFNINYSRSIAFVLSKNRGTNETSISFNSLFHMAVKRGDISLTQFLCQNGIDINCLDEQRYSPLHFAALYGYYDIVKILVSNGALINLSRAAGSMSGTPLHLAALNGNYEIVKYLVENGAELNSLGDYYRTPLHYAALNGHIKIVEYMVEYGAQINRMDGYSQTPSNIANNQYIEMITIKILIEKQNKNCILLPVIIEKAKIFQNIEKYLIRIENEIQTFLNSLKNDFCPENPLPKMIFNYTDKNGKTLLHHAASSGMIEFAKYLIDNGIDINVANTHLNNGNTPLFYAIFSGNLLMVEFLISNCANINQRDFVGFSPLDIAKRLNNTEIIEVLLKNGAR